MWNNNSNEWRVLKAKMQAVESKARKLGYQTEDKEREYLLVVKKNDFQIKLSYGFIANEAAEDLMHRLDTEYKCYLKSRGV